MNEPNFFPLRVVVVDISAAANLAVDKLVADTLSFRCLLYFGYGHFGRDHFGRVQFRGHFVLD